MEKADEWREVLAEYIIYGLLFRAIMADVAKIERVDTHLNYRAALEQVSMWAEKQHHHYRKLLRKLGCEVLLSETRDGYYYVQVKVRGYIHENFYNPEVLKAECEVRMRKCVEQLK